MLNSKRNFLTAALVATLVGCASPTGTEVDPALEEGVPGSEELLDDPAAEDPYAEDPLGEDPYAEDPTTVVETPVYAPVVTPAPAPAARALDAYFTLMDTSGAFWWKKVTVTGEVHNPGAVLRSGTLTVEFTKDGNLVETREKTITGLGAGETFEFEFKSTKSADHAQVAITTH